MRFRYCILLWVVALAAWGQEPAAAKIDKRPLSFEDFQKVRARLDRAFELRPRRRDTPLRELNISDDEVREIEAIARRQLLSSMLNISPVVSGCACEEGPFCTDQVYVVATTADGTLGLQLSRIRNAWVIGPVQQWWDRFAALEKRGAKMDFADFFDARNALLHEFPMCVGKGPDPDPQIARAK
jgi:hypothetical protein